MTPRRLFPLALVACLAALTPGARATTLVALSENDLIDASDLVVRGLVLSVESAVRERGIPVFTDVVVQVEEVLKGETSEPLIHVSQPGGTIDGMAYAVAGTPRFQEGEEVLVFLKRLSTGERVVLGLSQGKYRLVPDAGGATLAERSLGGAHFVPQAPVGRSSAALRMAPDRMDWASLRQRIRERVRAGGR